MQAEIRICMISPLAASERAEQPRAIQRAVKGTAEVVRLDRTFASGFGANQPTNQYMHGARSTVLYCTARI